MRGTQCRNPRQRPIPGSPLFELSHDRLVGLLAPLDAEGIRAESYDTGWPIAQVASHLGSQAEIFELFLDAGLGGGELPGSERFQEIWGQWDSSTPERQVARSIEADESFVSRIEGLDADQRASFRANLFGNPADLSGLLAMRLAEHALHTWDVAVALDPTATVSPDAVALITDATLALPPCDAAPDPPTRRSVISVNTTNPSRSFALTTGPEVSLAPVESSDDGETLQIPAEALVRLVYGRLDVDHTPAELKGQEELIGRLRAVFPGF